MKPSHHHYPDGTTISIKEIAILFNASHIRMDGVHYEVPEGWEKEKDCIDKTHDRCYIYCRKEKSDA